MPELERERPDPLPPIHPTPEYLVSGQRAQWYEDMKRVFQVPWMGVVTMAFSHYPHFFDCLWRGLKPLAQSQVFVQECAHLRTTVETQVHALNPEPIEQRLRTMGYAPRELDQIRASIDVFSHGNFPYLLTATAARRLLEGQELGKAVHASQFTGRHAPDIDVPFVLMESHHADVGTREVYQDIMHTLSLPFVNTDYRALARWPSYFALAWKGLKPAIKTSEHAGICMKVHRQANRLMGELLPNPGEMTASTLRKAAERDGDPVEILQVARLFQWLLPGLVTNVAFFRAQLGARKDSLAV